MRSGFQSVLLDGMFCLMNHCFSQFPRGPEDKRCFVELLKELREAFEAEAREKKEKRLLLTAAVSAGAETIRGGYDVPAIGAYATLF